MNTTEEEPREPDTGVDRSMLRENLKLTPTERLLKHERALRFVLAVREAGKRQREAL